MSTFQNTTPTATGDKIYKKIRKKYYNNEHVSEHGMGEKQNTNIIRKKYL
jgi:hypothetical protein